MSERTDNLEIALRDLLNALKDRQRTVALVAAGDAGGELGNALQGLLEAHARARTGVHGVGPGFFVAKTANSAGFPRWGEIEGRPSWIDNLIDPSTYEFDADQITTGTLDINRLPVAGPGVLSDALLVRADDPRLLVRTIPLTTSEPLAAGDFVSVHGVGGAARVRRARADTADGVAVGFVADSAGAGDAVPVFPVGVNTAVGVLGGGLSLADLGQTVFLSATPGQVARTPPSGAGNLVQPLGSIVAVPNSALAHVLVRYEYRIRLA